MAAGKPEWELEVATRDGRYEEAGWRVRKDGSRFWASAVITALRDETGRMRGFGKVTRDLTERHIAELERTKTEFLNLASHELRGPLAVVRGSRRFGRSPPITRSSSTRRPNR